MDDRSHGTTISGNTLINTEHGIFLHNSYENTVTGNTVYRSRAAALWIKEDSIIGILGYIHDNVITGNTFLIVSDTYPSAQFDGLLGSVDFGTYDDNRYAAPYAGYLVSQTVGSVTSTYQLAEWRSASGQDALSEDIGETFEVVAYAVTGVLGGELVANGSFDSDVGSWSHWASDSSSSISWVASCGLDGGCLSAHTNVASSIVNSATFPIESGKTYQVSWSAIAPESETGIVILRKGAADWDEYARSYFSVETTRIDDSFVFTSPVTIPNARVDFVTNAADTNYFLDNVIIREVTVDFNDTTDDMAIYTNPTTSASVVSLGSSRYCGLDNRAVGSSFSLPAFGSRVLLSCFDNTDGMCNNHETHGTAPDECDAIDDEGTYAGLDASSTMGSDNPGVSGEARIYANGKFRHRSASPGSSADLSIAPRGGFSGSETGRWMDLSIDKWETSGDRSKRWTESSGTIGSTVTEHIVGDLVEGYRYAVSVDGVRGADITGDDCEVGVCTAGDDGRISFSYAGGYSTHTFEVSLVDEGDGDDDDDGDAVEISHLQTWAGVTSVTLIWKTDRKADTRVQYGSSLTDLRYEAWDPERSRDHRIVVGKLLPAMTYYFRIRSRDGDGNIDSEPYIVVTTLSSGSTAVVPGVDDSEDSVRATSSLSGSAGNASEFGSRPVESSKVEHPVSSGDSDVIQDESEARLAPGFLSQYGWWIGGAFFVGLIALGIFFFRRRADR